eukprot:g1963.t1
MESSVDVWVTVAVGVVLPVAMYAAFRYFGDDGAATSRSAFVVRFMKDRTGESPIRRRIKKTDVASDEKETLRDFARNLASESAVYIATKNIDGSSDYAAVPSPQCLKGTNFSLESCIKARDYFVALPWASKVVSDTKQGGKDAFGSLMRLLSVGCGFSVAMERAGTPVFLQTRFVLLIDEKARSLRLATYGFVGPLQSVQGSSPDTKRTPYVCRLLTSDLFETPIEDVKLSIECVDAQASTSTIDIMKRDVICAANRLPWAEGVWA